MTPLSQKSHDISFAIFRVSTLVKNHKLRIELQDAAVELTVRFEEVANPALSHSATVIDILERLIMLAESIGDMKPINAAVLRRELGNFQTAILANARDLANGKTEGLDISSMFSTGNTVTPDTLIPDTLTPDTSHTISVRQTAIMRHVREIDHCRLRNILELMPNVSERTIRNDLQGLIERGLIRRVGGGGPNSYFENIEVELRSSLEIRH